jgi:hypothetical protein
MNLRLLGTCLCPADEDHRVASESRLWKRYRRIQILYGLTRGAVALLFFYRIMLNTLGKLSMVVKDH